MRGYGNGASGICAGHWISDADKIVGTSGSGHAIRWSVVDDIVMFEDGQTGDVYLKDALSEIFSRMNPDSINFTRLDELEPIMENIKKISRS